MSAKCSVYLNKNSNIKPARKPVKNFLVAFVIAFFTLFMSVETGVAELAVSTNTSTQSQTASAGSLGFLCGGKDDVVLNAAYGWKQIGKFYADSEGANRKWTLDEAYGNGLVYPLYTGEGEGPTFVAGAEKDRGKGIGNWDDQLSRLKTVRTVQDCSISALAIGTVNLVSGVPVIVTTIVTDFAVMVFDSSIICQSANDADNGNCFNLLKAVGGTSDAVNADGTLGADSGIMGKLTNGVYLPLIVLAVMASGMYIFYIGLVKRRLREAMFATIWVLLASVVGLTFLYKPTMLAKAPMVASNTIASCIISGYNGQSCWDGDVGSPKTPTIDEATKTPSDQIICTSNANTKSPDENMSLIMNGLSCRIWKAFLLEPYSQGNFGRSFEEMDTSDPDIKKAITKAKLKPNDFCVPMNSSKSVDDMGDTLTMDAAGTPVCNVVAYQLFLNTQAKDASGQGTTYNNGKPWNRDWYKVVLLASNDDSMWSHWSIGIGEAMRKTFMTIIETVTAVAGGAVIVGISLFAFVYYITSLLLITLAPLFFLLGVHPGRGKKILLGYGESVIENVFKYIASAMFLVVTVAIYDAVLGTMTNMGLTLIFVIILSVALFLYRKEIVNLIGKVNMGGQRLSNQFEKTILPQAQKLGASSVGGAIGGVWGSGSINPKDVVKNARFGATQGVKNQLRRDRTSLIGNTLAMHDKFGADNKSDLRAKGMQYSDAATVDENQLIQEEANLNKLQTEERLNSDIVTREEAQVAQTVENADKVEKTKADVLLNADGLDPMFRKMQALTNQLQNMKMRIAIADAEGDMDTKNRLTAAMGGVESERDSLMANFNTDTLAHNMNAYQNAVDAQLRARNLTDTFDEGVFLAEVASLGSSVDNYNKTVSDLNRSADKVNELGTSAARNRAIATEILNKHTALRGGENISIAQVQDIERLAKEKADSNSSWVEVEGLENNLRGKTLPIANNGHYSDAYLNTLEENIPDDHDPNGPIPKFKMNNDRFVGKMNMPIDIDVLKNNALEDGKSWSDVNLIDPETGEKTTQLNTEDGDYNVNPDKSITFTPMRGFKGEVAPVEYVATDSTGADSENDSLDITVMGTGNMKIPANQQYQGVQGQPVEMDVLHDVQIDGETLQRETANVTLTDPSSGEAVKSFTNNEGTYKVTDNNTVKFEPNGDAVGTMSKVDFEIADTSGNSSSSSLRADIWANPNNSNNSGNGNSPSAPVPPADVNPTSNDRPTDTSARSNGLPIPSANSTTRPTTQSNNNAEAAAAAAVAAANTRREAELRAAQQDASKQAENANRMLKENENAERRHQEDLARIQRDSDAAIAKQVTEANKAPNTPNINNGNGASKLNFNDAQKRREDELRQAKEATRNTERSIANDIAANNRAESQHRERLNNELNTAERAAAEANRKASESQAGTNTEYKSSTASTSTPKIPQTPTSVKQTPGTREQTYRGLPKNDGTTPQKHRDVFNAFNSDDGGDKE